MTIELSEVGEVLDRIYKSECPIRLEYVWDGGWVWTVLGDRSDECAWPRVWIDNDIQGSMKILVMNEAVRDRIETIHKQEKDWLYRGTAKPINEAVHALACALYLEIPDSEFGRWWKTKNDNWLHPVLAEAKAEAERQGHISKSGEAIIGGSSRCGKTLNDA